MNRKMLLSVLVIVIVAAALGGATMAWFSDTAESEAVEFQAGTLLIDIDNSDFFELEGLDKLNPGDDFEWDVTVCNEGTKNLIYKIIICWDDILGNELHDFGDREGYGTDPLSDAIVFTITKDGDVLTSGTLENKPSQLDYELELLLGPNECDTFTINVEFPSGSGNEYQGSMMRAAFAALAKQVHVDAEFPAFECPLEPFEPPLPPVPEGEVLNVDTDTFYSTIQDAVDAAEAGQTLLIGPGTYSEHVKIDGTSYDGLTLMGRSCSDRAQIDLLGVSVGNAGVEVLNAENVTVKYLEIYNSASRGFLAQNATGVIVDCIVARDNDNDGIRVRESVDATVKNSESYNNDGDGITFYAYGEVLNNQVYDNKERGIYHNGKSAGGTGSVTVSGNHVARNKMNHSAINHHAAGIEIYAGSSGTHTLSTTVENNVLEDNYGNGILIYKVNNGTGNVVVSADNMSTVKGNTVRGTKDLAGKKPVGDGILIYKSHYVSVENNTVEDNDNAGIRVTGIYPSYDTYDTTNNTVKDNNITNNSIGVWLELGAADTVVENNTYTGNGEDIKDES